MPEVQFVADTEKLTIMVLHGPEHPEHVTIPFVMACAALASDVEVVIGLQADGVLLARTGVADGIEAPGFPPFQKLLAPLITSWLAMLTVSTPSVHEP